MIYERDREYVVRWRDSQNYSGWFNALRAFSIAKKQERTIETRGVCVGDDGEYLSIAQSHTNGNYMNIVKILKSTICDHTPLQRRIVRTEYIVFLCMLVVVTMIILMGMGTFVRGTYGEKCYRDGDEPKSIKTKLYFTSVWKCKWSTINMF